MKSSAIFPFPLLSSSWVVCFMLACLLAQHGRRAYSQDIKAPHADLAFEAASIVETYLLNADAPSRFDVAISISSLIDMDNGGIGEEVVRIRWKHDQVSERDILAREKIISISQPGIAEEKNRKLTVYLRVDGKTWFRDLPYDAAAMKSGRTVDFRQTADAPAWKLTGLIPFTFMSIPSVYVDKLRENAVLVRHKTELSAGHDKISISFALPPKDDEYFVRKWLFDAPTLLPISTSSKKLGSNGEPVFSSGSFTEQYSWGRLGENYVPLSVRGERGDTRSIVSLDKPFDPDRESVNATITYDCELKWSSISDEDLVGTFDPVMLTDVNKMMELFAFEVIQNEADLLPIER